MHDRARSRDQGVDVAALAHLQLGPAYALAGNNAKAKASYQDFFGLWNEADPDKPILKQAQAEYLKLQSVILPSAEKLRLQPGEYVTSTPVP